jgi:hypothetical protein
MKEQMVLSEKQLKMVHFVFDAADLWSSSYWSWAQTTTPM